MSRDHWKQKPVILSTRAPLATRQLAHTVAKLFSHDAYSRQALQVSGSLAVNLAARGRSLRQLAKATGLSPAYLSLVANGQQRISLAALHLLLSQCEGVER